MFIPSQVDHKSGSVSVTPQQHIPPKTYTPLLLLTTRGTAGSCNRTHNSTENLSDIVSSSRECLHFLNS